MDASVSKRMGPPKNRYYNEFFMDEMVDWVEMEVEQHGKVKVSQDETEGVGVDASTSITGKGKKKFKTDNDSEYDSNKSVDYLSPGEEELIELRNRMKANREAKANSVSEMNVPNAKNSMHADNVRGDTFEEHDIYMNELVTRLNITDDDEITQDPFISIEKNMEMYPMYDETTHWRLRKPKVSEKYVTVEQFKECLTYYAMDNGFHYGKQRKQSRYPSACRDELPTCPWRSYARWMTEEFFFQCISLDDEHTCVRNFNFGSLVNYKWIEKVFGDKIRASRYIRLYEYEKTVGEHYAMLRSYGKEILDSNPESTVKLGVTVNPDDKTYFDRFYVCFAGLADGWKAGVAWAVVNVENKDNWSRFLELLEEDFGCSRGNGQILMSGQHKGLIEAVKDIMPNVEHMHCARHIYENFRKHYSRGCEAVENGFSESFNSIIVSVRHKPLLTMLEAIRVIVLERMNKMKEISRKWNLGVCPNIKKRLEWLKEQQRVPESYVLAWFEIDLYFVAYHHFLKSVPSMNFLPNQSMYSIILPPKPKKMSGRPRKKRIRSKGDGGSSTRVSKIGRPRKKQSVVNLEDVDVDVRGIVRDGSEQDGLNDDVWIKWKNDDGGLMGSAVAGGLKGGIGASGSTQSSVSASVSKRKAMSSAGTQKKTRKE
ncbi:multidrug resistance-associated protein 5 [Tanacetum coccineum]|uniref:Multidrug resistance-associated protein 5 n=1 Tax=Tanacetum coccineum TaxID=301880 RepID=A0ABQ4ZNK5_9ASTR